MVALVSRHPALLTRRALNRALLHRQLLLRRWKLPPLAAVNRLIGLQAQTPAHPYVALWSRLDRFAPERLERLLVTRRAVRMAFLRSTVHLVSADDALAIRPLLQPVQTRNLYVGGPFGRQLGDVDLAALLAAARALMAERPRSLAELGAALGASWPGVEPTALAYAVRNLEALVQVPPRGLWTESGQATCTTAEAWLGRPPRASATVDALVLRYLAAFGPASPRDAQAWSGLTGLGEVFDRLRPQLRVFRDEHGRALFDLPEAPRPDPAQPAPVRFLPGYDNAFLGHADRSRIVSDEDRRRMTAEQGPMSSPILIDGTVRAAWTIERARGRAVLRVAAYQRLPAADRAAVFDEGERLLQWMAGDDVHEIRFAKG